MFELPDELLASILAKIPLGKAKVGMQAVSRQWEQVLHQRAAHSLETWEEDEMMPYNPAVIQGGREGSLVSQSMMAALAGYKIGNSSANFPGGSPRPLGWLPLNLECLKSNLITDMETCPRLPKLRKLDIQGSWGFPSVPLNPIFPALEVLHLPRHYIRYFIPGRGAKGYLLPVVLGNLSTLMHLQLVSYFGSRRFEDFAIPPACRIRYSLTLGPREGKTHLNLKIATRAPNLVQNLQWLQLELCGTDGGVTKSLKLDLGELRDCPVLEEVRIEQGTINSPFVGSLILRGFEHLPAACKRVVLVPNPGRNHRNGGLPFVKPARGWETVLGPPGIEFFDPTAWRAWLSMGEEPPCPAFVQRVDV